MNLTDILIVMLGILCGLLNTSLSFTTPFFTKCDDKHASHLKEYTDSTLNDTKGVSIPKSSEIVNIKKRSNMALHENKSDEADGRKTKKQKSLLGYGSLAISPTRDIFLYDRGTHDAGFIKLNSYPGAHKNSSNFKIIRSFTIKVQWIYM